jgi:hypothetical protein
MIQPTMSTADPEPHADRERHGHVGGTAVVDRMLAQLAAVIHDRPVQGLVAGKLMLETATAGPGAAELVTRGLLALSTSGEHLRDLMWALTLPSIRPDHPDDDLVDAVSRIRAEDDGSTSTSDVGDADHEAVITLASVAQALAADALLTGGRLLSFRVQHDAEALRCQMVTSSSTTDAVEGPFVHLARVRLAAAGGRLDRRVVTDRTEAAISLPLSD